MTSKSYQGAAPLTMARTAAGGYVNIHAGDPVPDGLDPDDQKRLIERGFIVEAEAPSEDTSGDDGGNKPANVKDILKEVGDDPAKAQAALDEEKAQDKPRPSLVEKLQAVVDAGKA